MVDWNELDYANELTRFAGQPRYRRIVELLRQLISDGRLRAGDLLPTERDLARMAGLSRGTVSLAYAELKREGILNAAPGRGSRVATDQNVSSASRKEQALRILTNALERLEALGFAFREVEAFLHLVQLGREGREVRLRGALVDCNPEALALVARQLECVSQMTLEPFLLDEFARLEPAVLTGFDLVLTTERHVPQVQGQMGRSGLPPERLLVLAVSPSRETLVALARLPAGAPVEVHTSSPRFAEIIAQHLSELGHECLPSEGGIAEGRALVVPPPDAGVTLPAEAVGTPILFDYQVDRGSLLRIEETVMAFLLQKGEGIMGSR